MASSNSSSFEDLAKETDIRDTEQDDDFMDILGNNQLTKKVGRKINSPFPESYQLIFLGAF